MPFSAMRHDARRELDHLLEHQLLFARGIAQDRMQGGDHRHSEISQQSQQMAAARASKDSEFVLQAEDIDVNQIQKIGRPPVRGDILFGNFETHFGRIMHIPGRSVIAIIELCRPGIARRSPGASPL